MITGAHAIIYSTRADADREFLRDVLGFPHVDVGGGWLIFGLPPAEVAVHPSDENEVHELYLMVDDVTALIAEMGRRGVETTAVQAQPWGMLTHVTLPGGGKLGVYQPRHARPEAHQVKAKAPAPAAKAKARPAPAQARKAPAKQAPAKQAPAGKPARKAPAGKPAKKSPAKRR